MKHRLVSALTIASIPAIASAQLSFSDQSLSAGFDSVHAVAPGYPGNHAEMVGGGAVGDFNRDGRPDVFVPGGGLSPDRLFMNTGGAGGVWFEDQAAAWGVDVRHRSAGVAVGDFNHDGFDDIFVVSYGVSDSPRAPDQHRLYRNNAGTSFTNVASELGVNQASSATDGMGAAWGDYDLDGDLDLFVSSWFDVPGGNRLFRNDNAFGFTDVTTELGLDAQIHRGFTPRFVDMDGDHWPELLLTNDYGTSRYFLNEAGHFRDITNDAGITHDCNGMGSTIGDFDGDGLLDWYMTNIYFPPPSNNTCGNVLYRSLGGHQYENVAASASVQDGGWGWGTAAGDLDNDTDLDIVETSGWRTYPNRPARLFLNDGTGSFQNAAAATGLVHLDQGKGMSLLDYDADGDLDVIIFVNQGRARLFRNDLSGPDTHWVRVKLDTSKHPCLAPNGYGTTIETIIGSKFQVTTFDGSYTYLGQSQMDIHIGLGAATSLDMLRVLWANGDEDILTDVPADQVVTFTPLHQSDFNADGHLNTRDLIDLLTAYSTLDPRADFDRDGQVTSADVLLFVTLFTNQCI